MTQEMVMSLLGLQHSKPTAENWGTEQTEVSEDNSGAQRLHSRPITCDLGQSI